jgi:hypothetical protein
MTPSFHSTSRQGIWFLTGFHDGYLHGVRMHEGKIFVWCNTLSGVKYVIVVPELTLLRLHSFTGANIINAIVFYQSDACPIELYAAARGLQDAQWADLLHSRFDEFKKSGQRLIEFATSDGATLWVGTTASYDQITILPDGQFELDTPTKGAVMPTKR